jgi:cell fate (sporulation/competence/biofilm development) regulator YlbF (YheA/YmcA/DUF963 family)
MPVVLKTKAKEAPKQPKFAAEVEEHDKGLSELAEIIDQLGEMEPAVEKAKKLISQWNAKQKKLRDAFNEAGEPDEELIQRGHKFIAELSPRGSSRHVIDIDKVREYMGHATFMKMASVKLTDIDKYLTPEEAADVLHTTRDGNRSIKLSKREAT